MTTEPAKSGTVVISRDSEHRIADWFNGFQENCFPVIERFTVPLYGLQGDEVRYDRMGVLYRIAGSHFILTAAHQLRGIIRCRVPLFIPPSNPNSGPVPLCNAIYHTTEVERGRDVAVIKLDEDSIREIGPGKEFLTHDKIRQSDPGRGLYVVFGYPMDWTGKRTSGTISSDPLVYVTSAYTGEKRAETLFDPRVHIALKFERDAFAGNTTECERLPRINGISGCGIWRIADWHGHGLRPLKEPYLVALQHLWIHGGDREYIQGTWIEYAMGLILYNYPELRSAMSLA